MSAVLCFLGRHRWVTDQETTNGYRWRFCNCCGVREAGSYDMCYGETVWRRM
jgi:hypothetical protein